METAHLGVHLGGRLHLGWRFVGGDFEQESKLQERRH